MPILKKYEIETPVAIILIGVLLAIIAAILVRYQTDCDAETISTLTELSRSLVTGGLGGAVFKPMKSGNTRTSHSHSRTKSH